MTDDMKTHKNPELRTSSVVKAQAKPAASKPAPKYGAPTATKKPPVLELQGKKWIVVRVPPSFLALVMTHDVLSTSGEPRKPEQLDHH